MRRIARRNEQHAIEPKLVRRLARHFEMRRMNGIEGSSENSGLHASSGGRSAAAILLLFRFRCRFSTSKASAATRFRAAPSHKFKASFSVVTRPPLRTPALAPALAAARRANRNDDRRTPSETPRPVPILRAYSKTSVDCPSPQNAATFVNPGCVTGAARVECTSTHSRGTTRQRKIGAVRLYRRSWRSRPVL